MPETNGSNGAPPEGGAGNGNGHGNGNGGGNKLAAIMANAKATKDETRVP